MRSFLRITPSVWALITTGILAFALFTHSSAAEPRLAVSEADLPRVRQQWRDLAPHMSMEGPLALENIDLATVGPKLERIRELSRLEFEAHPLLQQIGPPFMKFLASCETRVIPTFRVDLQKVDRIDSDALFGGLILEGFSRLMEIQVLRAWQTEYDERLRRDYERMMPLSRGLASAAIADRSAIQVECRSGGNGALSIHNRSGQKLTNVTLAVGLASVSGPESMHYYFLPEWEVLAAYPLRLSVDWEPIGALSTTRVRVEMLSDERSLPPTMYTLDANAPHALDRLEKMATANIRRDPSRAIAQLTGLKRISRDDPEVSKRIENALRQARQQHNETIKQLERQMSSLAARKADIRRRIAMERDKLRKQLMVKQMAQVDDAVKQLQLRKSELVKVAKGE